ATAQRRFVADASHELRSPLASLKVSMDVAEIADTPEEWQLAAPVIRDELTRMTQLVDDLLFLARADDGTSPMRTFDVDIDDIVGREAIRLRSQTGLHIQTDLLAARTRGDPARLAQVIRNLADNASRFAASTIRFGVNVDAGVVRISIEDDGPGVPADQRERVLERFVRLDDARSRWDGGTGLGLAIAVEIIKAHGGSLRLDDSTLGGARVRVLLPIRVAEKLAAVRSQPITNATDRLKRAPVERDVNLAP
ncbi:MAG: HAMP domain-containing sensor histidine kinase, partial [Candidatus Nanopelagicales bacterium]